MVTPALSLKTAPLIFCYIEGKHMAIDVRTGAGSQEGCKGEMI